MMMTCVDIFFNKVKRDKRVCQRQDQIRAHLVCGAKSQFTNWHEQLGRQPVRAARLACDTETSNWLTTRHSHETII